MDELKQIITHKLKIMAEYSSINVEDISSEILIKEKRKQASREVQQSRLLQTLSNRRIQAPYRVQQFYHDSVYMMNIYDPSFVFSFQQNASIIENIVKLYGTFFEKQDCRRRTEQIYQIFHKKLCQNVPCDLMKSMLVSTLFGWFAEWTKKTFNSFIKNTLLQISSRKQTKSLQKRKLERKLKMQNEIKNHQETIKSIEHQLQNHRESSLSIRKSQLLDYHLDSIEEDRQKIRFKNKSKLGKDRSLNLIKNSEEQLLVNGIHGNPQDGKKSTLQRKQPVYLVNKQMLFSAFYEQINQYYKSYSSILGDLDVYYPKTIRKVDRRQELRKKFTEVSKSIARGQTSIKKSIDDYRQQYSLKFQKKQQRPSKQKQKIKFQLYPQKQEESIKNISRILQNSKLNFNERLEFRDNSFDSKRKIVRKKPELQKKTLQIELPQIKNNTKLAIHSKPSRILVVQSGRHNQKYSRRHSRDFSQIRLSIQLTKEINDINSPFKKKEHVSKTYNSPGRKSFDYQKQKNKRYDIGEISEYIQNNQGNTEINPDGGVFYLPSLPKN